MAARNNLRDIDQALAQIDASLEASDSGESQFADNFEKTVKEGMQDRMQSQLNAVTMELNMRMDEQMNELDRHLRERQNQREAEVRETTIDVHAQNMALQLISRMLGTEWREVYPLLFPLQKGQWTEKMDMIAVQAPNKFSIQAFRMLMLYKQEKGDEYRIEGIFDALNLSAKSEIIEEALKVLYSGGAEIYNPMADASRNGLPSYNNGGRSQMEREMPYHNRPCTTELPKVHETDDPYSGPMANHRLLGFARKLGDKWQQLASVLGVSESDLQELSEYDETKAAAFEMLYTWRDNAEGTPKDKLYMLRDALLQADCSELVDSLMPKEEPEIQEAPSSDEPTSHEDPNPTEEEQISQQ